MGSVLRQVPTLAQWDLLPDFTDESALCVAGAPLMESGKVVPSAEWISALWDPCEVQVDRVSMLAEEVTSSFLATDSCAGFQDTHSATDTSCAAALLRELSQHSACDLARISGDTAASIEQPSSSVGFGPILATSSKPCDAPISLCLDHGAVLRTLREQGIETANPAAGAAILPVILQFPASAARDAELRAAFGGYGGAAFVAPAGLAVQHPGPLSFTGSTPGTPQARRTDSDMPLFVPVAPHRLPITATGAGEAHSALSAGLSLLMPVIPTGYGPHLALPLQLGHIPQPLASSAAVKPSDAKTARAACALRCKQKKRNNGGQACKIRYEMRKINAAQRPRFKGRFVKRDSAQTLEAMEADCLGSCASSDVSALSDASWLML